MGKGGERAVGEAKEWGQQETQRIRRDVLKHAAIAQTSYLVW